LENRTLEYLTLLHVHQRDGLYPHHTLTPHQMAESTDKFASPSSSDVPGPIGTFELHFKKIWNSSMVFVGRQYLGCV
jgi:hypothetical protein